MRKKQMDDDIMLFSDNPIFIFDTLFSEIRLSFGLRVFNLPRLNGIDDVFHE